MIILIQELYRKNHSNQNANEKNFAAQSNVVLASFLS